MNNGSKGKKSPMLSVVMPVYNTSEYLAESIESVLGQTFCDFELILVNDGSTDNSGQICRDYSNRDSRIVVINKENGGLGSARNAGMEAASGKYITFPDSDDYLAPDAYERCIDILEREAPDLVLFGYKKVFMNKNAETEKKDLFVPDALNLNTAKECRKYYAEYVFGGLMNQTWNKLYRRSIIDEHNMKHELYRRAQDSFFSGEYFRYIGSMITIPEPLYYYRTFGTQNFWKKFPKDSYLTDIKYNSFIEKQLKDFGEYDGRPRELADAWFYNSVFRDAGYYRNPNWSLSRKEKIEYVKTVISAEYNRTRAKTAWTKNKKTERIQKRILNKDAKGLIRDIKRQAFREKGYSLYYHSVKKLIKRD